MVYPNLTKERQKAKANGGAVQVTAEMFRKRANELTGKIMNKHDIEHRV